jgi:serine/threonine protein kinase
VAANTTTAELIGRGPLDGRYRLHRRIGRGGSAEVWAAGDERLGREVAVKVFAGDVPLTTAERIEAELRALAALRHPALVAVYDAGVVKTGTDPRSPETPFLVMELVDGPSLRDRLAEGPISASETRAIGRCIASALRYVHGAGIVHRDVKPANILLDPAPSDPYSLARLADFGIARLADAAHLTGTGTAVGTASYLSPEQVRSAEAGPASDVYALALVLLECLTGRLAFPGSGVETALARLHRNPTIPDGLGADWQVLLAAMTARDPRVRPSAGQVEQALRDPGPVGPRPSPTVSAPFADGPDPLTEVIGPGPQPAGSTRALAVASGPLRPEAAHLRRQRWPHRSLRWALAVAAAVIVVGFVTLLITLHSGSAGSGSGSGPAPSYPTVPGTIGRHLDQLEKAIG